MNERFLVFVNCITYNQATYIEDTLNGFSMQQTDFPFICGIIDDASTDGEQEVIQHYLDNNFDLLDDSIAKRDETDDYVRIFARHKENKHCYFVVVFLKYNHYRKKSKDPYVAEWKDSAKYVALCEGDDYWIDPNKLLKQAKFMEDHPDHSLCFCAYQKLFSTGEKVLIRRYEGDIDVCPMEDIILGGGGYMATNSMFFRASSYVPYRTWAKDCPIGDLPAMLSLARMGKVGFLSDVMCVYRVAATGSWSVKMKTNNRIRFRHFMSVLRMWRQFDKWSNREYHKLVRKKMRINCRSYIHKSISLFFRRDDRKRK